MLGMERLRFAEPGKVMAKTTTERITWRGAMCSSATSATTHRESTSTKGSIEISMRCSSWSFPTDMRVIFRTESGVADCAIAGRYTNSDEGEVRAAHQPLRKKIFT